MDVPLSARSGRNVGIEPTLLPFVQAGAAEVVAINQSSDTVVAQYTEQAARVLFASGNDKSGYLFNNGPGNADVDFFFVDELGNEISLTGAVPVPVPAGSPPVPFLQVSTFRFFCLARGEKIVARATPSASGTQDVVIDGDPVVLDGDPVVIS